MTVRHTAVIVVVVGLGGVAACATAAARRATASRAPSRPSPPPASASTSPFAPPPTAPTTAPTTARLLELPAAGATACAFIARAPLRSRADAPPFATATATVTLTAGTPPAGAVATGAFTRPALDVRGVVAPD